MAPSFTSQISSSFSLTLAASSPSVQIGGFISFSVLPINASCPVTLTNYTWTLSGTGAQSGSNVVCSGNSCYLGVGVTSQLVPGTYTITLGAILSNGKPASSSTNFQVILGPLSILIFGGPTFLLVISPSS